MKDKIAIGIAEDHDLVREGFISILRDYDDIKVLFEASNGKQLLKRLKEFKPAIILLDIEMPVLGGIAALAELKQHFPKVKIIVISAHAEPTSIIEYVKLGAIAFLPKNCKKNALIKAIYSVKEKGTYFEEDVLKLLAKNGAGPLETEKERKLTESEITVLKLLCDDRSFDEIATLLDINARTAKWYKHRLLVKTKTENTEGLLQYAIKHKYLNLKTS